MIDYLLFHSKGANLTKKEAMALGIPEDAPKRLSNFAPVVLVIDTGLFPSSKDGFVGHRYTFASPEHAFQGAKYLYSNRPNLIVEFTVHGALGHDPIQAKSAGSKGGMKKRGTVLNVGEWNSKRDAVMVQIVEARMHQDPVFHDIVMACTIHKIPLIHYSLRDKYWGTILDKSQSHGNHIVMKEGRLNKLGNIYHQIGRRWMAAQGLLALKKKA